METEQAAATVLLDAAPVPLRGRLDARQAPLLRDRLHAAADGGDLVVDLSEVTFVDAVGIGVLLGTRRRAARAGHVVSLHGATPLVRRQFARFRLSHLLAAS